MGSVTILDGDMEVTYESYENRMPTTMNWKFNGQTVETFAVETNADNRLPSIANSSYRLDLTYDLAAEKTESGLNLPLISEIIRTGPGFAETLTPRYGAPADGSNPKLDGIEIVRHTNGDLQSTTDDVIIIEDYDLNGAINVIWRGAG